MSSHEATSQADKWFTKQTQHKNQRTLVMWGE